MVATLSRAKPDLHEAPPRRNAAPTRRRAGFDGGWREIDVWERSDLGTGSKLRGPAVVEFTESTLVVRPDWQATVDGVGTLNLERHR